MTTAMTTTSMAISTTTTRDMTTVKRKAAGTTTAISTTTMRATTMAMRKAAAAGMTTGTTTAMMTAVIAGHEHGREQSKSELKKEITTLVSGAILFGAGMIVEKVFGNELVAMIVLLLGYAVLGWEIIVAAGKSIIKGRAIDETVLMSVATIGAIALSDYAEAAGVMLFYRTGELLQNLAVGKSRRAIRETMDLRAEYARVLRDEEALVSPDEVKIGEQILVKTGRADSIGRRSALRHQSRGLLRHHRRVCTQGH